jgi:murein hydrolase activator
MKSASAFLKITRKYVRFYLILIFCFAVTPLKAQSRKELEIQRRQKEKEIRLTRRLLNETSQKQRRTLKYLNVLEKQIRTREELIANLQNQLHLINLNIMQTSDLADALGKDLESLKKEYARLLYYMYKNRNRYNLLTFVFSANSYNEAYKRLKFTRYYTGFRKKQFEIIQKTQSSLSEKITILKEQQAEKQIVLEQLGVQKRELENDKADKSQLAESLKGQKDELKKQLREQQRVAQKLDNAIRNVIKREMLKNTKAGTTSKSNKKTELPDADLTPEILKLSSEFAANRSKLPWPVERGYISEYFGTQNHPSIENVIVNNSGIKIRTPKNSGVRTIFSGEVSYVIEIPGANHSVIVKHGKYFTVYSNLKSISVKRGDKIRIKQQIGTVGESLQTGETELELQVWKGGEKLNPAQWIYRK